MLYAAADPAAPSDAPPPSPRLRDRVKGYATRAGQVVTTYGSKAERIIDAPVYDAAAVLGVDVIWLGGVIFTLKIVSMGLAMEFRKPQACCPVCPTPHP